jgi:hypothetical protein
MRQAARMTPTGSPAAASATASTLKSTSTSSEMTTCVWVRRT